MVDAVATLKTCRRCGATKVISEFPNDRSRPDGRYPYCKVCNVRNVAKWREDNPDKWLAMERERGKRPAIRHYRRRWEQQYMSNRKRLYGVDGDEFRRMQEAQGFRCAICQKHQDDLGRSLAVDHSHVSGKARGLLCQNCNAGIGNLGDDTDLLRRAIAYLEEHGG